MDWLVTALSSGGLGSIVGLAGGLVTKWVEHKDKKSERAFSIRKAELSLREIEMEQSHELLMADKQMERAKVEGNLRVEQAEVGAFTESMKTVGKLTGFLRFVRPAITAYLLIASTALFSVVWVKVDGLEGYTPDQLQYLLQRMIEAALFLTVTCVSWWFASRGGNLTK